MCVRKMGPWNWVHKVFYYIMRYDGVPAFWAFIYWWVVWAMGPGSTWRWLKHLVLGKQDPLGAK